jgi:hypothetical protein
MVSRSWTDGLGRERHDKILKEGLKLVDYIDAHRKP